MESQQQTPDTVELDVSVRPLRESDLPAADRVRRLAFGTLFGLPEPMRYDSDANIIWTRWLANPAAAFGAELDGELVGSNFAINLGSVGFFGPLSVRPDLWNRGIAKRLLEPIMELFVKWSIKHAGIYANITTPKNVTLYQKFGFWPRFLTTIMSKPVRQLGRPPQWSRYSEVPVSDQAGCLSACRRLTDAIYEGLDLEREIQAINTHSFGDTVLLWNDSGLMDTCSCNR